MNRLLLSVGLSLILIAFGYSAQGQNEGEEAVLIIGGPGINADIYGKDQQLLYQVYQMFGVAAGGFTPTNVQFKEDTASTQKGEHFKAARENRTSMNDAAASVGELAAKASHSALMLDMDLGGTGTAVTKGLVGAGLHAPLQMMGSRDVTGEVGKYLDSVRTSWNVETDRTAVFIKQAAREFKRVHGPNAKVIVVGHSAFTNAIDLVPLKDGKKQLIDFRIMSSPMVHSFKYHDPDHTVIVTHESDLPSANMGDIWSSRSTGDLTREGTVLRLKGIPYGSWWEPFLPDSLKPIQAHSQTHYYTRVFDMDILTPGRSQPFRGTLSDVIKKQMAAANEGQPVARTVIQTLQKETPKESRVGGISLTKPAEVPLDPDDIQELQYSGMPLYRLSFLMESGESIALPHLDPAIEATAFACVYLDRPPEIHFSPFKDAEGIWWNVVSYIGEYLPDTSLSDAMMKADNVVGDLAWGNFDSYRQPASIPNYHPYVDLALDNKPFQQGKLGGRAWLVPAVIRTKLTGGTLAIKEARMAFRFEFYDADRTEDYYAGKVNGRRDPGGEFLAAQLTNNYEDLQFEFPELKLLKETATIVGILIWAHENDVHVSPSTREAILQVYAENRGRRSGPPPVTVREFNGQQYYVSPAGMEREVTVADIARPAVLFNQFGPSRYLWTDGNESRIEYENGRIVRLVGRQGDVTKLLYDRQSRPVAIADSEANAVAIFWRGDVPILCEGVSIDLNSFEVIFNKKSRLRPGADVPGFLSGQLGVWVAAQGKNERTDGWLRRGGRSIYFPHVPPWIWLFALTSLFFALLLIFAGRLTPAGSIRMSWALRQLRYGIGDDIPRRAAETLGKSKDPRVVSALVKRIKNGKATLDAYYALTKIGAPAVKPLIGLLKDKNVNAENAAEALGEIGDPRAVEPLRVFLGEQGYGLGWSKTVRALEKIGDALCVRILLTELQHPRKECRWEVICALARTRNPVVVKPLIKALGDKEPWVRSCAVGALEDMGDVQAIQALLSIALTDQEIEVRQKAAKALHQLGWQPENVQMKVDMAFALRDWDELARLGSPAVDRLINELRGKEYSLREEVAKTLGKIGDWRAVEPLIEALKDWDSRKAAANALGEIKDIRAAGPLAAALSDDVTMEAMLYALEQIGPAAAAPLADALKRQKPRVRAAIAITLGRLGGAGIEGLRMAIEDPDVDVQQAAVSALGNNEDPRSVALLEEILRKNSNIPLRQKAVRALELRARATTYSGVPKAFDINALGPLVEALGDKDFSVREEAKKALYSWVSEVCEPAQPRPEPSNETERRLITLAGVTVNLINLFKTASTPVPELTNAIRQLGIIGDRHAVGYLTLLLDDENVAVRFEAVETLKILGHVVNIEAVEAARMERLNEQRSLEAKKLGERIAQLFSELNKGDWDERYRAATELSSIKDPRALESLKEAFKGENAIMRQAVVVALGRAGNKRAAQLLIAAKKDKDSDVRFAADRALIRIGVTTVEPLEDQ